MGEWLISIAGTPEGARLATILALTAALAHALFGALQKGRHDPWLSRGAIDAAFGVISAPVVFFVVPWPDARLWAILAGAVVIHFAYKLTMALAYERAAYTVVYPVVRGTGPLITVLAASVFFAERYTALQWLGVAALSAGILALAARNVVAEKIDRRALQIGLGWAFLCGTLVALYTTYDAFGIRAAADPFTFLAWFFFLSAVDMPWIALRRWRRMADPPAPGPLALRGLAGAFIGWISFGGVMLATMLDSVGEAAVLRETSTVFAAVIGWAILGEKVGFARAALMTVVAAGAVMVEMGG